MVAILLVILLLWLFGFIIFGSPLMHLLLVVGVGLVILQLAGVMGRRD